MKTYGLIGENLEQSFSAQYFKKKFISEKIKNTQYLNFELKDISEFKRLAEDHEISGLNVTIPYKEKIIPFLDELSEEAKIIGAVNTIRFKNKKSIGYNTDHIGFANSIKAVLDGRNKAIVIGDGGSAKAIKYALKKLDITFKTATRNSSFDCSDITSQTTGYYNIIINTTPLGSYPKIYEFPEIPYEYLNNNHLLFDLIYNPEETKFLSYGKANNAQTKNGLEMLKIQAEESWNIWCQ